jgi:plasmid stabilization system protein ParE
MFTREKLRRLVQQEARRLSEAPMRGRGLTQNRRLRDGDEAEDDAHAVNLELGAANGRMGAAMSRLRSMASRSSSESRAEITQAASELQIAIDSLHAAMELVEALDYA